MARGINGASPIRRTAAVAIAAAAMTGLAACGAGQAAQTAFKDTPVAGINVDAGDIALRDLQVEFIAPAGYAVGDSAPLSVWISNGATETVTLIGVTSEFAEQVVLVDEALVDVIEDDELSEDAEGDQDAEAGDDEQDAEGEQGTEGDEQTGEDADGTADDAEAESTEDETATEDETDVAVGTADIAIELPSFAYVRLDTNVGGYLLLENLLVPVGPGVNVPVTFHFSNGESVTAEIPYGQAAESPEREFIENPGVLGGDH